MSIEKPRRRMTLQEVIVNIEKFGPLAHEYMQSDFYPSLADVRETSRPHRKHSPFPTRLSLHNSLENLKTTSAELQRMTDAMMAWFGQLQEHLERERNRYLK
jgi:hypothetical protein